MRNLATLKPERKFSKEQIELMHRQICKDATSDEMMVFLQLCSSYGLNPFKREAYLQVFNKNDASKRSTAVVLSINAYRAMAERSGNYRPDEEEPEYTYSESLKDPKANPLGIEKCVVRVFKQDKQGRWHPIKGAAYWDEFVKIGKYGLDGGWKNMPRLMIAKCAESQALRKGWPETFNGTYLEEEVHHEPEDVVEYYQTESAISLIERVGGKDSFTMQMKQGEPNVNILAGEMADTCFARIREINDPDELRAFWETNTVAFRQFYAMNKVECHEVKAAYEAKLKTLGEMKKANDEAAK